MLRLLIIAQETGKLAKLCSAITQNGFACSIIPYSDSLTEEILNHRPDIAVVEIDGHLPETGILIKRMKQENHLPIIALVSEEMLDGLDGNLDIDDFVVSPYYGRELALRANRLLRRTWNIDSRELIKCASLVIDLATCEVTVDGRIVELTFKEYELLKLLAGNRGRVYTRETLLNKVWGYDYYGGDRTVDVHVRRLRSKIEDSKHNFVETVRNIGYRFKKNP